MRGQSIWVRLLQKSRVSGSDYICLMTVEAIITPTLSVKDVSEKHEKNPRMVGDKSRKSRLVGASTQGSCKLMTKALAIKQIPNMILLNSSVIIESSTDFTMMTIPKQYGEILEI